MYKQAEPCFPQRVLPLAGAPSSTHYKYSEISQNQILSIALLQDSETGGHRQLGIVKQLLDTLPLLLKDTNTTLERQRNPITCLADTGTQIVELVRKLLAVLALSLSLAVTLALTFAFAFAMPIAVVAANGVVNFSLELVYDALGVEDALCDLELATRIKAELMVWLVVTRRCI